jgi:twitching motility protein PilT
MQKLDQILEHLFSLPGTDLLLESNSSGAYRREGAPEIPVFRQLLRTGQILLLFADVVPKEHSQALLAGQPIEFNYKTPKGPLQVHMEMRGSDIRVEVKATVAARSPLAAIETPVPTAPTSSLVQLLEELPERHASHLHLVAGQPAFLRVEGSLARCADGAIFSQRQIREALGAIAPAALQELVQHHPRFDFTWVNRASVYHVRAQDSRGGLSVVIRALPRRVPTVESLGVPTALVSGMSGHGLWVLAGAAGQGSSTTLAALAQAVLEARPAAVCAVESPIEYVLAPAKGVVEQLEVGTHVESFSQALLQARSTDADLIVVGELDAPETLAEAVALADCGRLVLGSLHAGDSLEAVDKMLTTFAGNRAAQLRLAAVLRGVFAQQLVPNLTGGRTIAWEVLESTDAVRGFLRAGQLEELGKCRSHRLEESLLELVLKGEVEAEVALAVAGEREWLEGRLSQAAHTRAA